MFIHKYDFLCSEWFSVELWTVSIGYWEWSKYAIIIPQIIWNSIDLWEYEFHWVEIKCILNIENIRKTIWEILWIIRT